MGVYKNMIEQLLFQYPAQRLVLDGTSQYAHLPSTPQYELSAGMTVHLDLTPRETTGDIIGLRHSSQTGWGIRLANSRYVFTKYGVVDLQTATLPEVGTREVLTFVYQADTGSLRVFRNYTFLASYNTGTSYLPGVHAEIQFGTRQSSGSLLEADFYEVAFIAGAMSDEQVTGLANSRGGAFSRLIGRGGQWSDVARGINATLMAGAQVVNA